MGQSFFQGEVSVRLLLEGSVKDYAIPRDRLADAGPGSRIPVRNTERFSSYFWVMLTGEHADESGSYFVAERVKQKPA